MVNMWTENKSPRKKKQREEEEDKMVEEIYVTVYVMRREKIWDKENMRWW